MRQVRDRGADITNRRQVWRWFSSNLLVAIAVLSETPQRARAACNVIPPAVESFRGTLASTDRPFARPGDWVRLQLNPTCHAASPGFTGTASDLVVSVIFEPPGGARNVIALATDCGAVETATCGARADVDIATCLEVNGGPIALEKIDQQTLRFRFPDSDLIYTSGGDGLTFTGPVTIAVTAAGTPLPCGLASVSCRQQSGTLACIDALYAENGTCNGQRNATFSHFTALPPPNDYQRLCTNPSPPCTGTTDELRFTVDARGNVLIPMDWRGVRVDRDAVPIARLLRASSTIEAFEGRGVPIRIRDLVSLGSYSPNGIKLPPLFDPQQDPSETMTATFFGSTDAEETVLRIARHIAPSSQCAAGANAGLPCTNDGDCAGDSCVAPRCTGGSNVGAACGSDAECPSAECGPGLFEFRTRLLDDVGPVLLRLDACIGGSNALGSCSDNSACPGGQCGAFTLAALDPVPLDGLSQSAELNAFVMEEAILDPADDLNGDGDMIDPVVKLTDRATGLIDSIGSGGSEGRAVTRVQQAPFSFPALAVEDDVIAFLEPEPWQGASDTNSNGRVFDTILKVYRLGAGEATDPLAPVAADAAPIVNDRSLAISNDLVFFRSPEAANADQENTRANVHSSGSQASGGTQDSHAPSLSADGRHVAFSSHATNLVDNDWNNVFDIFVHDRLNGTTTRVSVSSAGAQSDGPSIWAAYLSATGRYVAFASNAGNLVPGDTNVFPPGGGGFPGSCQDIFVHDRDADADGIFDETNPGERKTVRVSIGSDGTEGNAPAGNDIGSISPDGRFVTFSSEADNLVPGDGNGARDIFIHDRNPDGDAAFDETGLGERSTVRISIDPNGLDSNGWSASATASGDGRFVVFQSSACNLIPGDCITTGDTNAVDDIFLRDRDTDEDGIFDEPGSSATTRVSVSSRGTQSNAESFEPRISADGSTVVFASLASNLVPGDTNSFRDVFAYDRKTGQIAAVTVTADGRPGKSNSGSPMISGDGRFVSFNSVADNLVPGFGLNGPQVYLHDRLSRLTTGLSLNALGGNPNNWAGGPPAISLDGTTVAYYSPATDLVAGDTNAQQDIFVRAAVPTSGDLSGDGQSGATLLRVVDTTTGPPSDVIDLCPAQAVAVANGRAAFLRPEAAGTTPSLSVCPTAPLVAGKPDLNVDGDADDSVVHFWDGSTVANFGRAASAVAASSSWVAALVSEPANGNTNFNLDSDEFDTVVQMHPAGAGAWINIGQAADAFALAGTRVAFLTPEKAQANDDLNGDDDPNDRVVQTYDAASSAFINIGQAAEDLVIGSTGLIAFRTLEASQNGDYLNEDGDADDGVLQVYDAAAGVLLNSRQAVTPCRLEACDPSLPYRVRNDTVTFLTLETDQNEDLNGDGDHGDLVLQVLNVRQACSNGSPTGACHAIAAASAGICTDSGEACVDDDACDGGDCFVPPGGCVRDLAVPCNPLNGSGCAPTAQYCQPTLGVPTQGTCFSIGAACDSDADCTAPAFCSQATQEFNRLMDPLGEDDDSSSVFTGAGLCTENFATPCGSSSDCQPGEFCASGNCHRQHGVCASDTDCPTGSLCQPDLLRATADDADQDELPDVIDNCPQVPNIQQTDLDSDGVGDACDAETCGNGVAEESEDCDDGNVDGGDGCEADCSLVPVLVSGTKMKLSDSADIDERSLLTISKDAAIGAPTGTAQDPTIGGGRLELYNESTNERAYIDLPAHNWAGIGSPPGAKGYKYVDKALAAGPCKLVLVKPGRLIKAVCRGSGIDFTLNESQQGSVRISLRLGAGTGALKHCLRFGGTIVSDYPTTDGAGKFQAKGADAPPSCPR